MVFSSIKKTRGFTVIELVIAISIFLILVSIAMSSARSLNNSVELENSGKNIDLKIKAAKARSVGALNDTNYGVHFENGSATVFPGPSYALGNPDNEVYILDDNVEISGISLEGGGADVIFDRLSGKTSNFGSVSVRLKSDTSQIKTVFINSDGQSSFSAFQTSLSPIIDNGRHTHFELGWDMSNSTKIILEWTDEFGLITRSEIDTAPYLNGGKLDWEGTVSVDGTDQKIRIHSWSDASSNSVLCVVRYENENDTLDISLLDGPEKHIATYERNGDVVNITPDATYGGIMQEQ